MKTTVKQSPALARTGALTLAILLGFSAAALPAQAQTAGKSKTAATKKAPQASSRSGDYIVAIVNSEPVTNHEVNRRASMLAQQLAANKVAVPDRATLLRRALNDEILQKAATFSARNSGMTVGDEELRQIEANLARDRKVSVEAFRKRIIAERGITASQYRQSLLDQILLERVRDARINAEVARISDIEALDLLREEQRKTGATLTADQSHARHILLRPAQGMTEKQALARLATVRSSIASGKTDFATAAREMSQDGSSCRPVRSGIRSRTGPPQARPDEPALPVALRRASGAADRAPHRAHEPGAADCRGARGPARAQGRPGTAGLGK